MIVRISGRLSEIGEDSAILDRDGIAYEVLVPSCALAELAAYRGDAVTLHTLEYLEGNAAGGNMTPRMIGFLHPEDRAFFKQFITVKGIGVRKGLRALAEPVARIAAHIEAGDAAALARLPGIGRRMSEQIVAELRGKVTAHAYAAEDVPSATKKELNNDQRDAIEILVAWGDSRSDAERWIARAAQLHADLESPEAWVRAAYRIKGGAEA
ncbi:MAG TPA: Holliday junction branch migration protein RuvA [Phycisphaerae bacterium]|nr:Holliday junction branch migration protein RuvA [Phycisphaerae bacterium]